MLRWVYRHIDYCTLSGERNREYLEACGVPEAKMVWVPHCVENDRFSADARRTQALADQERRHLGIEDDEVVFLFAGKLVARKQPELLLKAFLESTPESNRTHLIFVGTGPLELELKRKAAGHARVHFVGFRNQSAMPVAYRLGDLYVLPSSRDTWGLGVNEAMACAKPIIVSDRVGCMPDLASDRNYARVFQSGEVASLVDSMGSMPNDRRELLRVGDAAFEEIQRWSVQAAANAVRDAIAVGLARRA